MKWNVLCLALLAAMTTTGFAQSGSGFPKEVSGVYNIYAAEKRIQTDAYEVNGTERSVDVLKMLDAKNEERIEIAVGKPKAAPVPYRKTIDGVPALSASVENDYIWFFEKEAKVGALTIDPYLMFFDPTAYAGYTLLVRSYNTAKGGSQTFPVVVPALQDYCEIEVERHGSDAFTVNAKSISAAHYRMVIGKRETVNLWVDADRVIAIQLTAKGLTIVDAGYPDLFKEVRRVTSKSL